MKYLAAFLLLAGASGCTNRGTNELDATLKAATLAMRRGELDSAQQSTGRCLELSRATPASEQAGVCALLRAEILLRKRALPEALEILSTPPPAATSFKPLEARYEFLKGLAQFLRGRSPDALASALSTLERARAIAPDAHDVQFDVETLDGQIRYQLGRDGEAESRLQTMLSAAHAEGDRYHEALALITLGMGRLTRNRYDEALPRFEAILALDDLAGFELYATALNNAGICHARLGQFDQAIALQRRAIALHEKGARRGYEQALGQLGTTYLQQDDLRSGVPPLRQALTVATQSGLTSDAAIWAGNLADAHADLREWDEAERFNNEAKRLKASNPAGTLVHNVLKDAKIAAGRGQLDAARRLYEDALSSSRTDPSVGWSAHAGLARIALASEPDVAFRHFEAALQIVERTRSELLKTDYRLSFLAGLISFYREYVDALVEHGKIERALEVADSSRGRVLAERQGVALPAGATAATFRKRAADSGKVFLSYWLAPRRSYLWVVTPARVQLVMLPPAPEIEALVRKHQAAIDNVLANPLTVADGPGDRLFQQLVQPALASTPRGNPLVIVPDGALYALNFETLPVGPATGSPGARRYWIEDVEIAIAPSLAMLNSRPAAPTLASENSLLLIGNPTPRAPEYPALKYAGAEMAGVARHFSAGRVTSFEGGQAVPATYRSARPDRFSHVHFTAHATANLDSPLDSAVILSGPDAAYKLYARDVAALPLHAELVTVSACRSAGERTYSGEGLVGFAWAFLRGGARRVIAGLWDVDDKSTAELMDGLYERLTAGEPVGKALRAAKLTLLHRGGATAQPYYWAPFELFTLSP